MQERPARPSSTACEFSAAGKPIALTIWATEHSSVIPLTRDPVADVPTSTPNYVIYVI